MEENNYSLILSHNYKNYIVFRSKEYLKSKMIIGGLYLLKSEIDKHCKIESDNYPKKLEITLIYDLDKSTNSKYMIKNFTGNNIGKFTQDGGNGFSLEYIVASVPPTKKYKDYYNYITYKKYNQFAKINGLYILKKIFEEVDVRNILLKIYISYY